MNTILEKDKLNCGRCCGLRRTQQIFTKRPCSPCKTPPSPEILREVAEIGKNSLTKAAIFLTVTDRRIFLKKFQRLVCILKEIPKRGFLLFLGNRVFSVFLCVFLDIQYTGNLIIDPEKIISLVEDWSKLGYIGNHACRPDRRMILSDTIDSFFAHYSFS